MNEFTAIFLARLAISGVIMCLVVEVFSWVEVGLCRGASLINKTEIIIILGMFYLCYVMTSLEDIK